MSAFLLVGFSLWYSTEKLYQALDENSVALAIRSDQGLIQRYKKVELEERYFTQKDKEYLESLDSVKGVRSHTVGAARSSALVPLVDMYNHFRRYKSQGNPIPYGQAVLLGECLYRPKGISYGDEWVEIIFQIKEILLMGDEFVRVGADKNLLYNQLFRVIIPNQIDGNHFAQIGSNWRGTFRYFEPGRTYALAGYYDPGSQFFGVPLILEEKNELKAEEDERYMYGAVSHTLYMINPDLEDGFLLSKPREKREYAGKDAPLYYGGVFYNLMPAEAYTLPAAELWEGNPKAFFEETSRDIWRRYRDAWTAQQHSLPVVGTERLEAMYTFMAERASILNGRSFTEEEYASGARVLVISQKLAEHNNLEVGDRVSLTQYIPVFTNRLEVGEDYLGMWPGAYYNNPSVDYLNLSQDYGTEEESFTIVGTYKLLSDWTCGPYDFGPNTLLMPKKAQITGAFGEIQQEEGGRDIYGMLLSVELVNGKMDEFMAQIERSDYGTQFFAVDRGFEGVQKNLIGMRSSTLRLFLLSALGWGIFVILFLLMYQGSEKKNMGTMRSLGETRLKTSGYLFGGGWVITFIGIVLGTAAGALVLHLAQEGILRDAIASIDPTMEEAARLAAEGKLTAMYKASALNRPQMALFGAAQLIFLCLALGIHTNILARRHPRRLMEG